MEFQIPPKTALVIELTSLTGLARFRDWWYKSSVTLCNNLPVSVRLSANLVDNNIWASYYVHGGSAMLLVDPLLLSSCEAACFSSEHTNQGNYFCVSYVRERILDLGHKYSVTFYSMVPGLVGLALMPTPGRVEISGNLRLRNLGKGDQFHVSHSAIIGYRRTATDYKIRALVDVNRGSAQLLVRPDVLTSCDAVCFSFERNNKGAVFRATYFRGPVEVYFDEDVFEVSEAAPDFYVQKPTRAYRQVIGMSLGVIELRRLLKDR